MSEYEIILLDADDPRVLQTEALFREMYEFQEAHGLLLGLAPDGPAKWLQGVVKGLGRFGCLVGASDGDRLVGFAHGSLQVLPDYLGGGLGGFISHLFVRPEVRGSALGQKLAERALLWLQEKGVSSVELQVLVRNERAIRFWEKLGFVPELFQLRKFLS
jgi:ribosomal protein S18 acetylase RimI-like enzyme